MTRDAARVQVHLEGGLGPAQAPGFAGPGALRDHLTAPLADGGHGLTEASYTVTWYDNDQFHDWDHHGGTWFNEALLHDHEERP